MLHFLLNIPGDGSDGLWDIGFLKLMGSQQDGMGVGSLVVTSSDVVVVLLESGQTDRGDLVEGLDLVFSLFVVIDVTVGLPFSTSVLDFDVAGHGSGCRISAEHEFVGNVVAAADNLIQGKSGSNHDG